MALSVGVRTADKETLPKALGVQEQLAVPLLEATAEHPGRVTPPSRKETLPSSETEAMIEMAAPKGAVVTPPVSAIEIVGVSCETRIEIAFCPDLLALSVATT